MNHIQALQMMRRVVDHEFSLHSSDKHSKDYLDILEEAYATIHGIVEEDAKDFHFGSRLRDRMEKGNMISYNYQEEYNGYDIKISIQPVKGKEHERVQTD